MNVGRALPAMTLIAYSVTSEGEEGAKHPIKDASTCNLPINSTVRH